MKLNFFIPLLLMLSIYAVGQTTAEDVNFLKSDFPIGNYGNYKVTQVGVWGLEGNDGVKRSVNFKEISLNSKKRGVAIVYQELKNSRIHVQKYYFIPEKGSPQQSWNSAYELISRINNKVEMRTILWAIINYSSNIK